MDNCENIKDILCLIVTLQRNICSNDGCENCTKPYLGPNECILYNTRPVQFQSCQSEGLWTMPYTLNGTPGTSTVFRIENLDDNCATFRVLAPNPNTEEQETYPYVATNDYFTINLKCIGAIKCLGDTYISGV